MTPVAGDEVVCGGLGGALQNTIGGVTALDDFRHSTGLNERGGIPQNADCLRRPFLVPTELARQDVEGLLQDKVGQVQLETTPPSEIENEALVSGKVQSGDEDVRIEDYPHAPAGPTSARYSSTSGATSSTPMPCFLAVRSS